MLTVNTPVPMIRHPYSRHLSLLLSAELSLHDINGICEVMQTASRGYELSSCQGGSMR